MKYFRNAALKRISLIVLFLAAISPLEAQEASTFHSLSFQGGVDGAAPASELIEDGRGNYYGMTSAGGDLLSCGNSSGCGTIFKIDPAGTIAVLYIFGGGLNNDGSWPSGRLAADHAGNLYGTTYAGGSFGQGTVFKLDSSGNETVLHSFNGMDGRFPLGGLVRDAAGYLYGTTSEGIQSKGTVFKMNPSGKIVMRYTFKGAPNDGANPYAGLIRDGVGNLYGTTLQGGTNFQGTVFKVSASGTETVLHSFGGAGDGSRPVANLFGNASGSLYGTTNQGGDRSCNGIGCGTVFKIDTSGVETVLYSFTNGSDGSFPTSGLVEDAAGNVYGVARGGSHQCGLVFKLDPLGDESVLHDFIASDGCNPNADVRLDSAGNLLGTTASGGDFNVGTVFKLTP